MKTTLVKLLTLALVVVLGACNKEGDPGPAGEQGPQGEQGLAGPKGEPGTANVIYSEWMEISWNEVNEPNYKTMRINESKITSDFLENGGSVLYYIRHKTTELEIVIALPYFSGSTYVYGAAQINAGQHRIGLIATTVDASSMPADFFLGLQFRYVLVPGGVITNGRFGTDYETIKSLYNIPD